MALTLIKEDGSGRTDANAYGNVADCDSYHEGHLYATMWTAALQAKKEAALVMATRLIDAEFQFNGWRGNEIQALQWPRERCPDLDGAVSLLPARLSAWGGNFLDDDSVPKAVLDATCELARELLSADRTAAPEGEGVAQFSIAGGMAITFDKGDRRPVIPELVKCMLAKLGCPIRGSSGVKLLRT